MQDHVHARQTAGRCVFFLTVERDGSPRFIPDLEQERPRSAGGVADGCCGARLRLTDADDLRHDLADFAGRIELSLAFSALGGEVPHQVFVGVTQNVIAVGAVLREIERLVFKDGDQVGEPVHLLLAIAKFGRVVEIRKVRELVGIRQRRDDLLIDLITDVRFAFERNHVGEAGARRNRDWGVGHAGILVADVLHEE